VASRVAYSLGLPLIPIAGHSLASPFHGETESALRAVFDDARARAPSVIVIDEIDALAPKREEAGEVERRVVATLLMLMDGLDGKPGATRGEDDDDASDSDEEDGEDRSRSSRVIIIAATNRPNAIDPALRRPGRFDREIEIGTSDLLHLTIPMKGKLKWPCILYFRRNPKRRFS
jgi:AAA family ATPase